jgi:two-component system sensor histidine kinase VicK
MLDQLEIFHHLLQGNSQLAFVYSVSAKEVLYVNDAYERLFAPARCATVNEDLPGLLSFLPPEDQDYALSCLSELANGALQDDLLLRMQQPNMPMQWLCVRAHRAVARDGQVLLCGTVQDVTVEQEYTRNADKFMAKKNTTLEILSHDLAGPFNMLQQLAEFFRERTQGLQDAQLEKMVQVMQDTCRESVNLIREFVDSEFAESSSVQLKKSRVDLAAALRQVMSTYQRSESLVDKTFSFSSTSDEVYVDIDNNKFLQVINNLLSNSIKFTREGGHIDVTLAQQADHVLITVADDGIGIPEKLQPVLFDRFTKARRPGLRGEKTTGLGMSIIQALVQLHGGTIWFESQENVGTTFYIKIPA